MKINILTLFPNMFEGFINESIIKRARDKKLVDINIENIRDYTEDKHKHVDDTPYGGGAGMVLTCQPIFDCVRSIRTDESIVILLTPDGEVYKQEKAYSLSKCKHLIMICGHYEGFDERIRDYVDVELSIGDFILTGGELASMVISDAIIRLLDGAISEGSTMEESFENGLLEYPQYTFPREYDGEKVPDILFTGNHEAVRKWRLKESLKLTMKHRPDLLINRKFTKEELKLMKEIEDGIEEPKWLIDAINNAKKFM